MHATADNRNHGIDFLKALGLSLIVLAHVSPPSWLFQIRNFDVPLMVFLSGSLCNASFSRAPSTVSYVKKRFFRLVVPTWVFLSAYFSVQLCCGHPSPATVVVHSFLLQNHPTIGFVWVIRVYFLVALVVPLARKLDFSGLPAWLGLAALNALCAACHMAGFSGGALFDSVFYYVIPYGTVMVFGMCFDRFPRRIAVFVAIAAGVAFCLFEALWMAGTGTWCLVQDFKYPPRFPYLLHAAMFIFPLKLLEPVLSRPGKCRLVVFMGQSSLWIYLWHIPILRVVQHVVPAWHWSLRFAVVLVSALALALVQNKLCDRAERRRPIPWLRVFRG